MNNNQPAGTPENITSNAPVNPADKNTQKYQALLEIQQQQEGLKQRKGHIKAYTLSILLPPIGIYYFIKYAFFADSSADDYKAAAISLVLTILSLIINIWLLTASLHQIGSVSPQSSQFLQDLITPANQNDLKKLLQ